jgi:hypothetical protein
LATLLYLDPHLLEDQCSLSLIDCV